MSDQDDEHKLRQTIQSYDRLASDYVERNKRNDWWIGPNERLDQFQSHLSPPARVLDLGCGPGHDTVNLTDAGYVAYGVDLSSGMLAQAQIYAGRPLTLADMRRLPFARGSFDGIWMSASLLHVPRVDAPAVLAGCAHILKPGGVMYLSAKQGTDQVTESEGWGRTFTLFGLEEITGYVRAAGFDILAQSVTALPIQNWISVYARVLPD